jgi:hypothetical protein
VLYGQQAYSLDFHQNGWTPAILKDMLVKKGLEVQKIWQAKPYNIFCEAQKLESRRGVGDAEGKLISKVSAAGSKKLEDQVRAEAKQAEIATEKAERQAKRSGILKRYDTIMKAERERKAQADAIMQSMTKADKPNGHAKVNGQGNGHAKRARGRQRGGNARVNGALLSRGSRARRPVET